jgi:hypothetical protein
MKAYIKDRNTDELVEIVDTREMGWCMGGWWMVTVDGKEVASYDVDFPQSQTRRPQARYEAVPKTETGILQIDLAGVKK